MAFTVEHFHQLTQLLYERPEWRAEMRLLLLTEEILNMPRALSELTAAQQRTEEGLQQLGTRVEELTAAQLRTEGRLDRIESDLHVLKNDVADLKGLMLEQRHWARPYQYFRRIIYKARTLTIDELRLLTDAAVEKALLTENEAEEIELADSVVRGRDRQTRELLHLVIESSWGIGEGDVKRAARRAALLADTGTATRPVAAGKWATSDAHNAAGDLDVWLVINGHTLAPDEEA